MKNVPLGNYLCSVLNLLKKNIISYRIEEVGFKTCLVDNHCDIFYECNKNDDKIVYSRVKLFIQYRNPLLKILDSKLRLIR